MEKYKYILNLVKFYKFEAVFLGLGALTMAISAGLFIVSSIALHSATATTKSEAANRSESTELPEKPETKIYVDISGSVMKPDSYEATAGSRLKDLMALAGGLSESADKEFFYKNYNLSKLLSDQEKIYIPSVTETANQDFAEMSLNKTSSVSEPQENSDESVVHINTATADVLDRLPGIGLTTAQKIIDNRPYASINDLLEKKAVSNSTFEKIKELIGL